MKSSLKYSKAHGWLCSREILCKFCGSYISVGDIAWYLRDMELFACEKCYKDKRKVGKLYGYGQAIPTKVVEELPKELQDDEPEKEW